MSRTAVVALLALGLCGRAGAQAQGTSARGGAPAKRAPGRVSLGPGYKPGVVSTSFLLRLPGVREEIGLSDAQAKEVDDLAKRFDGQNERFVAEFERKVGELRSQGATPDEVSAFAREADAAREPARGRMEAAQKNVLDPRQRARLEQVRLQTLGVLAFDRPDFQRRLNLDPDQIEAIRPIVAEANGRVERLSPPAPAADGVGAEAAAKAARSDALAARSDALRAISKVLTKRQRALYHEWLGPPFDFAKLRSNDAPPRKPRRERPAG